MTASPACDWHQAQSPTAMVTWPPSPSRSLIPRLVLCRPRVVEFIRPSVPTTADAAAVDVYIKRAVLAHPGPGTEDKANRRSYGTGSLLITTRADRTRVYYGKFRDASGPPGQAPRRARPDAARAGRPDQVAGRGAPARPHRKRGGSRLPRPPRTLEAAADAWLAHLDATGTMASSVRAYRATLHKTFLPASGAVGRPDH
jgi:hypothetical protein